MPAITSFFRLVTGEDIVATPVHETNGSIFVTHAYKLIYIPNMTVGMSMSIGLMPWVNPTLVDSDAIEILRRDIMLQEVASDTLIQSYIKMIKFQESNDEESEEEDEGKNIPIKTDSEESPVIEEKDEELSKEEMEQVNEYFRTKKSSSKKMVH